MINLAISLCEADYHLSLTYRPQRPKLKSSLSIPLSKLDIHPEQIPSLEMPPITVIQLAIKKWEYGLTLIFSTQKSIAN